MSNSGILYYLPGAFGEGCANEMTLSVGEIIVRSLLGLSLGVVVIAVTSAYTARPSRRKSVSFWVALPILIAQMGVGAGSCGVGFAFAKFFGGKWGLLAGVSITMATLWCASIVIQLAQNVGYRLIGVRPQTIRWYRQEGNRR